MRLRRRHIISSRRYPIRSAEDIGFNEWLYQQYGISSDDMTDEDYDEAYNDYQDYLKSCQSIHAYEDLNDEEVDISDYEYCGNREGYQVYRKIVKDADGKHHGEWAAQDQDGQYPPFKITYMQARGYDPIDKHDSDVKKLGRELGRMLLPNSSTSIKSSSSFDSWYDSLSSSDQDKVDNIADENGIDFYDEVSDEDLAFLKDQFEVYEWD